MDVDDVALANSMGCTVEVKSGSVSSAAINECYFNMFGCTSRLAIIQLEMGNIIQAVNICGVVVGMEDPSHAVLLSLNMNFGNGSCEFRCVDKTFEFIQVMNLILSYLAK